MFNTFIYVTFYNHPFESILNGSQKGTQKKELSLTIFSNSDTDSESTQGGVKVDGPQQLTSGLSKAEAWKPGRILATYGGLRAHNKPRRRK